MRTSVICICLLCILKIVSTLSISEDSFLENPIIENDNICVSEGCVRSAASILANVDKSINPCDDFYKFACGKFTTDAKVDDDKLAQTTYSAVNNVVIDKVRRVLEQPIKNDEPRHSKLAKQIFACCVDERKLEERGINSLQQLLFKVGGWPVIMGSNWNELDFQWTDTIYKFRDLGMSVDYLIDISIKVNPKDTTSHIIELDRATLNMNSLYLKRGIKDKMVNSYYRYMVDIAVELGAEKQMAKAELRRVLDFEVKLARISLFQSLNEIKDFMISESNITTLTNSYPKVPWKEYINKLICRADNICVHDNQKIMVIMPSYLTGLEVLLKFTPKRVLANYLIWRAVESSVAFSNRRLRDRQLLLQEDLFGRIARGPRWVECVNVVSSVVDLAVSSMYVNNFFNLKTKKSSSKMVENLREEFYRTLTNAEWMDPITKKNALEKAEAIEEFVAYPDELLDYSIVDKYYSKVQLEDDSDYFRSVLQLIKLRCDKSFEKLHTPVNKSDWITHGQAITVNAFYNLVENSIQLPAGVLQGMFFSADRPNYMNYGGIGYVIGHEITHGFDHQGRLFDKKGNLREWWHPETSDKYMVRTECMIRQYSNYIADKEARLRIDGLHTIGENIADNGGVMLAYNAYGRWLANKTEPRLPGLYEYSGRQMFWINAANIWCSVYRPETLKHIVLTGVHPPGQYRVIGTFQNQPEFANDFKCPLGSYMNPKKKCKVW